MPQGTPNDDMNATEHNHATPVDAIILAAGKGTRMQSDLPKVMHEVGGRPMLHWVIDACRAAGADRIVVVVGFKGDLVRGSLAGATDIEFVEQTEQLGTGHAVDQARAAFGDRGTHDVFVLCGDGPLIRTETLSTLLQTHRGTTAEATLATAQIENPSGYGRILRDAAGDFERIVEQKDATPEQLEIGEVNPSYYCFRAGPLFDRLARTGNDNANGEYYVTDVFGIARQDGARVAVVDAVPAEDVLSINDQEQLAIVDEIIRVRHGINSSETDA
ncbi:MAG: NTP transferase domain-containing protein [Planctomycetia bacterium]|nr:NTP transferase domain-containing protein [Planctomycetia bacterium]